MEGGGGGGGGEGMVEGMEGRREVNIIERERERERWIERY